MPPSLASCWLLSRLPRFHARNPDIELQVIAVSNDSFADSR
jgi:DNA-binding transcriptional LysR family regulator